MIVGGSEPVQDSESTPLIFTQPSTTFGYSSAPEHASRFVSVKTLAELWDCSKTTVSRLLKQPGVPAYYFGSGRNGSKRYLKEDVDRFLQGVDID